MIKSFRTVYHPPHDPTAENFCLHVMGYAFGREHLVDTPTGIHDWFINLFHDPVTLLCEEGTVRTTGPTIVINRPHEPLLHGSDGKWVHSWLRIGGKQIGKLIRTSGLQSFRPYPLEDAEESLEWLEHIDQLMRHSHGEDTLGVQQLVELWLHRIAFLTGSTQKPLPPRSVRKVMRFIEANFTRSIPLEQMASVAHLSRSQMCRLFRKHTATSPQTYLQNCRIDYAKELLHTSEMSVEQIAQTCGYCDISHFSKAFKQATGLCPSQYRI